MSFVPPPMPTIADLLPVVARGEAEFAAHVGGWVLVGQIPLAGAAGIFRTAPLKGPGAVCAPTGEIEAMLEEHWTALVIHKKAQASFADSIFIGRATSNDVCIPHTSVSKLHARVRRAGNDIFLTDAGSSNGTLINGDSVGDVDVAVGQGDLLRFGSVLMQCFEPHRLHGLLRRFLQARSEQRPAAPASSPTSSSRERRR